MATWSGTVLEHMCGQGVPYPDLVRCAGVSREWRDDLRKALPAASVLSFGRASAAVGDADARAALARVAGHSLRLVDLRGCLQLGPECVQDLLAAIDACCPGVAEVNLTGCQTSAALAALAARARTVWSTAGPHVPPGLAHAAPGGVASPRNLYDCITAWAIAVGSPEVAESSFRRLPLGVLCEQLRRGPTPHLTLCDAGAPAPASSFLPAPNALLDAAARGAAWEGALLLGLQFEVPANVWALRCFTTAMLDSKRGSVLCIAAARADNAMVSLLLKAAANVDVCDGAGNSALALACAAGSLEVCQTLLRCEPDVALFSNSGQTPLHVACVRGRLDLVEALAQAGSSLEDIRTDDADPLALALGDAGNAALVAWLLEHGPERVACPPAPCDLHTYASLLAEAFVRPRNLERWLRAGASPQALMGEIGALLALPACCEPRVWRRLELVRSFIQHYVYLLGNVSLWPVPHTVCEGEVCVRARVHA